MQRSIVPFQDFLDIKEQRTPEDGSLTRQYSFALVLTIFRN